MAGEKVHHRALVAFVALLGFLTTVAVGCDTESKEEPASSATPEVTAAVTVTPSTATSTAEAKPSPTGTEQSTPQQIKEWLLQELVEYRVVDDVIEGVQEIVPELLGRKITRDQTFDDLQQRKENLSQILVRIQGTPPPPSVKYETDLENIHTSLVQALKGHIASLDSLADYLGHVPPEGGMPSDLVEATRDLEEATAKVEEAFALSGNAIDRAEEMLREISD